MVGVPTLEVVADSILSQHDAERVAVGLAHKRGVWWSAVYAGGVESAVAAPALRTVGELCSVATGPAGGVVMALAQPEAAAAALRGESGVRLLEADAVEPRVESVLRLGWARAERGAWDDPAALVPIYAREPEAVRLWEQREEK